MGELKDLADSEVISRVIEGRTDDFGVLLDRYHAYVFKVVSGHVPYDAVPDLAHDVFVEAYRSLTDFDGRMPFKNWLAGIAVHHCYDYWRIHYRNREIPMSAFTEDHRESLDAVVASEADSAFSRQEAQKEAREILQAALVGLSPEDRMVLVLVHFEGHSVKEAAGLLGWSSVNVKVRAHRSRAKLRRRIADMLKGSESR